MTGQPPKDGTPCRRCGKGIWPRSSAPGPDFRHVGRGLCGFCYSIEQNDGRLHLYPRRNRPAAEVAEDVEFLRGQGLTHRQMAQRLGMSLAALRRALHRHQARQRAA